MLNYINNFDKSHIETRLNLSNLIDIYIIYVSIFAYLRLDFYIIFKFEKSVYRLQFAIFNLPFNKSSVCWMDEFL